MRISRKSPLTSDECTQNVIRSTIGKNSMLNQITRLDEDQGQLGNRRKKKSNQEAIALCEMSCIDQADERQQQQQLSQRRRLSPSFNCCVDDFHQLTSRKKRPVYKTNIDVSQGPRSRQLKMSQLRISTSREQLPRVSSYFMRTQQKQRQKQQQQRASESRYCPSTSSGLNLILSLLIGLSLAAIHSNAFTGQPQQTATATTTTTISSSASSSVNQQSQSAPSGTTTLSNQASAADGLNLMASYHLQPPPVTAKPSTNAAINMDGQSAAASINLIPIDQPIGGVQPGGSVATSSGGHINNNAFRPMKDSYDGSSINLRSGPISSQTSSSSSSASSPADSNQYSSLSQQQQQQVEDSSNQQQQQQQSNTEDEFSEPIGQFYTNDGGQVDVTYQTITENQQQQQEKQMEPVVKSTLLSPAQQLVAASNGPRGQSVERRFGLFKKGHHHQQASQHYGAPAMSANYAASPFGLTDCERCLASLNNGQSADLQQLEPAPLPPPPPPPPANLPSLAPMQPHFPIMQPFAPLKSKFFMKFPFLVKPSPFSANEGHSNSYGGSQSHYWPIIPSPPGYQSHHQASSLRPSSSGMSQALFIRPAPAYNCIQASPPLLAAASAYSASHAEVLPPPPPPPSSKTSPLASVKQQHYGLHSSAPPTQQQVQGYAKRK